MMEKDDKQLFQERVDELLLLEQRADRRAKKFIELTKAYQKESQKALNDLLDKVGGIDKSLRKMNAASDSINESVAQSTEHAKRSTWLFFIAVIAAVLIIASTLWWSHHIKSGLVDARAELASLNTKLKYKPDFIHFHGRDYVRVVPDSKTIFTRKDGSEEPGTYFRVWHAR